MELTQALLMNNPRRREDIPHHKYESSVLPVNCKMCANGIVQQSAGQ